MSQTKRELCVCDPLYGYIYFNASERALIEHPAFQRLRLIQQLGFSQYAFPSGIGNRFAHSLGACHLSGRAFDRIFSRPGAVKNLSLSEQKKNQFRQTLRMAALLHDIGHSPLSHSGECLMPKLRELNLTRFLKTDSKRLACHEDYSLKFILDTELSKIILKAGIEPLAVAQLLHREVSGAEAFFKEKGINYLPLLRQIISSDLDVDRMDYLHRDSLNCGVGYGLIDFAWMLCHFDFHRSEKEELFLALASPALYTVESFFLGRQHMRMIVYFHHKAVIYNEMLKRYANTCGWKLAQDIEAYSRFTDSYLFDRIREGKSNEWTERILNHKPYLRLYESRQLKERGVLRKSSLDSIKKKLARASIPFMEIDSENHSINPSKKQRFKDYKIFVKNHFLPSVKTLFEESAMIAIPERRIERLYVKPEWFKEAKALIQ